MTLYHFTSKDGYEKITGVGYLIPSRFDNKLDANYGEGWYFTNLDENTHPNILWEQLWAKGANAKSKTDYYLKFQIDDSLIDEGRDNVYILPITVIEGEKLELRQYSFNDSRIAIEYLGGDKCPR